MYFDVIVNCFFVLGEGRIFSTIRNIFTFLRAFSNIFEKNSYVSLCLAPERVFWEHKILVLIEYSQLTLRKIKIRGRTSWSDLFSATACSTAWLVSRVWIRFCVASANRWFSLDGLAFCEICIRQSLSSCLAERTMCAFSSRSICSRHSSTCIPLRTIRYFAIQFLNSRT